MKYKITLWRNDSYCTLYGTKEECAWTRDIEADSKAEAVTEAISIHVDKRNFKDRPFIYEIQLQG